MHKRSLPDIVNEILAISRSLQTGLIDLSKEIKGKPISKTTTLGELLRPNTNRRFYALEALLEGTPPKDQSDKSDNVQTSNESEKKD